MRELRLSGLRVRRLRTRSSTREGWVPEGHKDSSDAVSGRKSDLGLVLATGWWRLLSKASSCDISFMLHNNSLGQRECPYIVFMRP